MLAQAGERGQQEAIATNAELNNQMKKELEYYKQYIAQMEQELERVRSFVLERDQERDVLNLAQ